MSSYVSISASSSESLAELLPASFSSTLNTGWQVVILALGLWAGVAAGQEPATSKTLLYLPLAEDSGDHSPLPRATATIGVEISRAAQVAGQGHILKGAAKFDGRASRVTVKDAPRLGAGPFEISMWVKADDDPNDLAGDLVSQFDPDSRIGFHLGIYSHGGVTNSQPNTRQLHFGIDQGRIEPEFTDHGRVGEAVYIFALCVHDGKLYAATCSAGKDQAGHVYRFEGGDRWTDLGSPDQANAISAMVVYDGQLYVASSKYRLAGSSLAESENLNLGGRVYRLDTTGQQVTWQACGQLSPDTEAVASLVVYRGRLYASSLYRPAGFFRYEGGEKWSSLKTPDGKRVEAMTVMHDGIYATSYDEGSIFKYDGEHWESAGTLPEATQTYGFGIYRGQLYVSEWPKAHVYRYAGGTSWQDAGKLGDELEAMPLLVYNGKMYGGSLPSAQIFRHDQADRWTLLGSVDQTPDVKYRRAWSMAVYQGRLFIGTLPSGRVLSIEAGVNCTWDQAFPSGWHHIRAIRQADHLQLLVDGQEVARSRRFDAAQFNLDSSAPLEVGFGAQNYFHGQLAELRLTSH